MNGSIRDTIQNSADKVLAGGAVDRATALVLASAGNADLIDLFSAANRVREHFRGNAVDICSIVNAKSGA